MRHLIVLSVIMEVSLIQSRRLKTTLLMHLSSSIRMKKLFILFLWFPKNVSSRWCKLFCVMGLSDRKDQKTLERLRAERQAKIDELKEKTNYYITQQLIQRYDPDPAAKAAAATVLASKLGSDSGLKVYVGDEHQLNVPTGKSNDVEVVQSSGMRNRKQLQTRSSNPGSPALHHSDEIPHNAGAEGPGISEHDQLVVEHHTHNGAAHHDGGWIARIAALLVGEDPTESYALICGNCHMHNGLARKEDFPYVTYYCPHCHALNQSKQAEEHASRSNSPRTGSADGISNAPGSVSDGTLTSSSPVRTASEIEEVVEKATPENPVKEED
ncbi:unnamed protein product, partial [Vitis vinifera]